MNKQWLIGAAKIIGIGALAGGGNAALTVLATAPAEAWWIGVATTAIATMLAYIKHPAKEIRK